MKKNYLIAVLLLTSVSGLYASGSYLSGKGGYAIGRSVQSVEIKSSKYTVLPSSTELISRNDFLYSATDVDVIGKENVSVYVNPLTGQIVVNQEKDVPCMVFLYNMEGLKMMEERFSSNEKVLTIPSNLSTGVYILSLQDESGNVIYLSKILKENK